MPKALDITNQKFGRLTALNREPNQNGKTYWRFKCDCGNEKVIQTCHVTGGKIKSCGCLLAENSVIHQQEKICPICGESFKITSLSQSRRKYCEKCSPSTNNPTIKIRAMREAIIKQRGGKCEICGYNKCMAALEFHHIDPTQKDFEISNTGGTPSFESLKEEANKCRLLCANCHREEHERLKQESTTCQR